MVQSMAITTKVVITNPVHGEVYSIQIYVIKFLSDLRQVGGFLRILRFPSPIKLTTTNNRNIVESGVQHHKPTKPTNQKRVGTLYPKQRANITRLYQSPYFSSVRNNRCPGFSIPHLFLYTSIYFFICSVLNIHDIFASGL